MLISALGTGDLLSNLLLLCRLGAYQITDIAQEIEVEKIIKHEDYYYPVPYANDIALLKLKTPAEYSIKVWGSYASQTWILPWNLVRSATLQAGEH